jgi:hypothetical protein
VRARLILRSAILVGMLTCVTLVQRLRPIAEVLTEQGCRLGVEFITATTLRARHREEKVGAVVLRPGQLGAGGQGHQAGRLVARPWVDQPRRSFRGDELGSLLAQARPAPVTGQERLRLRNRQHAAGDTAAAALVAELQAPVLAAIETQIARIDAELATLGRSSSPP